MATISRSDYLALIGLTELAKRNRAEQERLSEAVAGIIGEERGKYGCEIADDFVCYAGHGPYGDPNELLRRQEITVEDA